MSRSLTLISCLVLLTLSLRINFWLIALMLFLGVKKNLISMIYHHAQMQAGSLYLKTRIRAGLVRQRKRNYPNSLPLWSKNSIINFKGKRLARFLQIKLIEAVKSHNPRLFSLLNSANQLFRQKFRDLLWSMKHLHSHLNMLEFRFTFLKMRDLMSQISNYQHLLWA